MAHTYEYPRAALTVDCVVLGHKHGEPSILLVRRARPPFEGAWALPGGFVDIAETLEQAALRELREETGVVAPSAIQLRAFDAVHRDPRERVISIAHLVLVDDIAGHRPHAADDASEAAWFPIDAVPTLAFDHAEMIAIGRREAKERKRG